MGALLVVMGSGETAPTMVKPHRAIFERIGDVPAVLLDTPYGFQENADDISTKAVSYFATSVGRRVAPVSWRVTPPPGLARDRALAALNDAGWIFAGPGSPTYTLRQWLDTPIPDTLAATLEQGGVVLFASAAALTLGSHAIPVYEIYKAGFAPAWTPGLDLVRRVTGLPAVVIPHYDNAEGGHHDTRFCYLGERRLAIMERELPEDSLILGVDEHTAVLLDLDAGTASVVGRGGLTIRRRGTSIVHPTGSVLGFDELASSGPVRSRPRPATAAVSEPAASGSLRADADRLDAVFAKAYAARDVDGCVAAILDLEQVLVDWAADTLTSDEGDHARATLRRMVLRLGELAAIGATDPREVLAPFVAALLELRGRARKERDFATSDWVRDQLGAAGVEVRDTPEGFEWELRPAGPAQMGGAGGPVNQAPRREGTAGY
jgi:cyanophycinase-like exopeptidase